MRARYTFFAALVIIGVSSLSGVRAQEPTPSETPKPADKSAVKVTFDEETPGVAFIEVGGERLRVNTLKKTVERADATAGEQAAFTAGITALLGVASVVVIIGHGRAFNTGPATRIGARSSGFYHPRPLPFES